MRDFFLEIYQTLTDKKLFVKQPQLRWVLGKNTRKNEYKKNNRGRRRTREGEGGKKKYKGGERKPRRGTMPR